MTGPRMSRDTKQREEGAPDPEDARKPDGPTDLAKPSWAYAIKRTLREFSADDCTDLAAALTYYAVLSLFPALVALISVLGVIGQGEQAITALLDTAKGVAPESVLKNVQGPLNEIVQSQAAGLGLVIGLLGALWSASGYVGAFGRAMNRIYGVAEGRPIWKLRPAMVLVTVVVLILVALAALMLVVSGPVAQTVGQALGLGSAVVTAWRIVKWPVLLLLVVVIVAILYYATPNVRQPKLRWMSPGAFVAILTWVVATVAFGFYVANFSSYNKTYGSLAGVIVFLLWLWITNLALLFGAEFDAEAERGRELRAGIAAEDSIQLPPRDTRTSDKAEVKREKDLERGRAIRRSHEESDTEG